MNTATMPAIDLTCPVCGRDTCDHWLGWTSDNRTIDLRAGATGVPAVLEGDRVVMTGVSRRVYRGSA